MRSSIGLFLALFAVACGGTTTATGSDVADGGTSSDGGTGSTCKAACLGDELDWGANGGLVSVTESSRVTSCTTYVHEESSDENGDLSCTDTLSDACSSSSLGAGDVFAAMQASDVVAAFNAYDPSQGPKVFGGDGRPCDGSILEVTYQNKIVDIGGPCSEQCIQGSACTEVSAGLRALASTLQNLDAQELQTPNCKGVFP